MGSGTPCLPGPSRAIPPSSPPSWMDASVKQGQGRKHQREPALQGGCQFSDADQPTGTSDLRRVIYELDLRTKISTGWGVEEVNCPISWTRNSTRWIFHERTCAVRRPASIPRKNITIGMSHEVPTCTSENGRSRFSR